MPASGGGATPLEKPLAVTVGKRLDRQAQRVREKLAAAAADAAAAAAAAADAAAAAAAAETEKEKLAKPNTHAES